MITSQESAPSKINSIAAKTALIGALLFAPISVKAETKAPSDTSCSIPGEVLINEKPFAKFKKGEIVTLIARIIPTMRKPSEVSDVALGGRFDVIYDQGGSVLKDVTIPGDITGQISTTFELTGSARIAADIVTDQWISSTNGVSSPKDTANPVMLCTIVNPQNIEEVEYAKAVQEYNAYLATLAQ